METLIKQMLSAIPQYLVTFAKLLSSPERYPLECLPKREEATKESVAEALKFVLISYSLILVLNACKSESDTLWSDVGVLAISSLIQVCLYVFAIFWAWKIMDSKRKFMDYFIIYTYNYGVVFIIITLFVLISSGYLKTYDLVLYNELQKVQHPAAFNPLWWESSAYVISRIILICGFILAGIWGWIGWGAYRIINNSTWKRGFSAMVLATIFSLIAFVISYFISAAIHG